MLHGTRLCNCFVLSGVRVQTHSQGWRPRTAVEDAILGFLLPPGGVIWKGTSEGRLKWVSFRAGTRFPGSAGNGSLSRVPPFTSHLVISRTFCFSGLLQCFQRSRPARGCGHWGLCACPFPMGPVWPEPRKTSAGERQVGKKAMRRLSWGGVCFLYTLLHLWVCACVCAFVYEYI